MLEVKDIHKHFGGIIALSGTSFTLGTGDLKCIIGPNGCGKSTLFNVITGAFPPTSGTVIFNAKDITGLPAYLISRLGIGRKFQVPSICNEITVMENLEIASSASLATQAIFNLVKSNFSKKDYANLLHECGLTEYALVKAGELPHGIKQRLEIMMLVTTKASLLLLDEPTAGMSSGETAEIVKLIKHIKDQYATSILVIEHDMEFVKALNCPLIVMMKGSVICQGDYEEIRQNPEIRRAYLGELH